MKLCRVLGTVVSTIKHPTHLGEKVMVVQPINERGHDQGASFVAIDRAQAGPGDIVLVNQEGNGARQLYKIEQLAVQSLRNMSKSNGHSEFVVQINSMENEADEVFDRAIQHLFEHEKDPITLIKMRDLYTTLELATDKCEDVGNVIESIMLKYA